MRPHETARAPNSADKVKWSWIDGAQWQANAAPRLNRAAVSSGHAGRDASVRPLVTLTNAVVDKPDRDAQKPAMTLYQPTDKPRFHG
jgi:hypothetical protein